MTAPLFVLSAPLSAAVGDVVELSGAEGRHAVSVKRLTVGERIDLTDGSGLRLQARVVAVAGRDLLRATLERVEVEPPPQPWITVVQALPKGDAGELAVTLLTEVGVDEIVPWQAERCVARWEGKAERGHAKWLAAAAAAAKQARRARFPVVTPLVRSSQVVERIAAATQALVLHEEAELALAQCEVPSSGEVLLIVGPEGGIAPAEVAAAVAAGAVPVRLGPTVMRAATAGSFAAASLLTRTLRWGS
ncbi:MAG: 16S rRNA (uracil(1498)-N(3))-methyltransferase [Candidatus Nanopelagicales bacterium]